MVNLSAPKLPLAPPAGVKTQGSPRQTWGTRSPQERHEGFQVEASSLLEGLPWDTGSTRRAFGRPGVPGRGSETQEACSSLSQAAVSSWVAPPAIVSLSHQPTVPSGYSETPKGWAHGTLWGVPRLHFGPFPDYTLGRSQATLWERRGTARKRRRCEQRRAGLSARGTGGWPGPKAGAVGRTANLHGVCASPLVRCRPPPHRAPDRHAPHAPACLLPRRAAERTAPCQRTSGSTSP